MNGFDVMRRCNDLFAESGMTQQELGLKMGMNAKTAQTQVWQFLTRTKDPHWSSLERFILAMGLTVQEFFEEER